MENNQAKKYKLIKKQLDKVEKKENKVLSKKEIKFIKNKVSPIQEKIESKIPAKLQQTLEKAFETGFKVVFEKGVGLIEKTYKKESKLQDFDVKHYTIMNQMNHKNINELDKGAAKTVRGNQFISTVEGSLLGALGIGIPDIPILIGMILKSIYEISLSYGFDYTTDREKLYILYLICAGVTKEDVQEDYNRKLERIAVGNRMVDTLPYSIDNGIKETSTRLAEAMLMAKFIQGLPIIGVVGGVSNFNIIKDITKMARIKYKKRYLEGLLHEK
ncbi:EcsC family protein [Niameybacter massiliensis]|uniref:EcsC family protein n=1 Tax=Niameybacter massiliensis TaxID=1658108 RepID=UPI0006B55635|nr:EcsC family protein [Niameybacter massiliensis]